MTWIPSKPPRQEGRVFAVTGGNAGLGYFAAEQLAGTGGRVVLASRSRDRAKQAMRAIRAVHPDADLGFVELDLSSLRSVRSAAAELRAEPRLDGLVLNAGMVAGSTRRHTTAEGNELVFGTNYLGHFALTALVWPSLLASPVARVVGLGSFVTHMVRLAADDLQSERRYGFFRAYGFSKHAIQGFALELARRIDATGRGAASLIAQPGFAIDGLSDPRPGVLDPKEYPFQRLLAPIAQGKNRGAAPIVRALLDPEARNGELFGPGDPLTLTGWPVRRIPAASSASPAFGELLWRRSEEWTGTEFIV
ncbi:SDR family NAD(P)-dependent oxidoreductase [Lysobacter korlensis]|uniref:SDR family NAD(P)-dependent oxidoreductase n=1 Tax=Lysobacter korlensis TaxID=553636 RepID=A0ABV6RTY7_9GAMM